MQDKAPPFATIQSLLAARAKATKDEHSHRVSQAAVRAIGGAGLNMGMGARRLCAELLPDFTSDELLYRHSQFPIYATFMQSGHQRFWARAFGQGSLRAEELHRQIEAAGAIEGGALRACDSCAWGDFHKYGTSYWRVFHQWPFLRHCPVHGSNLHSRCCKCGEPYARTQRLRGPHDPCESCGMQLFDGMHVDRQPGYLALAADFMGRLQPGSSLREGNPPLGNCIDDRPSASRSQAHLKSDQLLQAWGCCTEQDLAATLHCSHDARVGEMHRQALGDLPTAMSASLQCTLRLLHGSRPTLVSETDNMHTQRSEAQRKCPTFIRGERPWLKMVRTANSESCA